MLLSSQAVSAIHLCVNAVTLICVGALLACMYFYMMFCVCCASTLLLAGCGGTGLWQPPPALGARPGTPGTVQSLLSLLNAQVQQDQVGPSGNLWISAPQRFPLLQGKLQVLPVHQSGPVSAFHLPETKQNVCICSSAWYLSLLTLA